MARAFSQEKNMDPNGGGRPADEQKPDDAPEGQPKPGEGEGGEQTDGGGTGSGDGPPKSDDGGEG
jgi:hypothetical protein